MGSPVTLSNFNSIDFNTILNLVMEQASRPLYALQDRQSELANETGHYSQLATKLGTLETAAAGMSTTTGVTTYAASVSDSTAVGVTPTSDAVSGTYDIVVTNLARSQVSASTTTTADVDTTVVATGGSITISVAGQDDQVLTLEEGTPVTLEGLAELINDVEDSYVSAAVVQSAPGTYRLVLTSASTGLENAFTITNGLTGGTLSGDLFSSAQTAADASIEVNGLDITSASNTLTSVLPGATLTLLHADETKTITVSVNPDDSALVTSVKSFVSAYNDLIAFITDQTQAAISGEAGTLANDAILREARNALRAALGDEYGTGTFTHLAEVGIGFNRIGQLTLTPSTLTAALAEDRAAVAGLFAGTATVDGFTNGAFGSVQRALHEYTQTGGLISDVQLQLNAQGRRLTTQISDMEARLAVQRAMLQAEYTAADQAMTALRAQSATLSSTASDQSSNSLLTNG